MMAVVIWQGWSVYVTLAQLYKQIHIVMLTKGISMQIFVCVIEGGMDPVSTAVLDGYLQVSTVVQFS